MNKHHRVPRHRVRRFPATLAFVAVLAAALAAAALASPGARAAVETPLLERGVCLVSGDQVLPAISGARVAWADNRSGDWDIYLYDLVSDTETRLTDEATDEFYAAISGTRIVWTDYRDGNGDIYLYDLTTDTETRLTDEAANQQFPATSGMRVVWTDERNGNPDVYLYDLATGVETRLTDDAKYQRFPAISGTRVVWQDNRNGNWDIYLYDLASGVETQITDEAVAQREPAISGPRVVWQDQRNGNWDIYAYDLASGVETQITDEAADQYGPDISGTHVVWEDSRSGDWDIYLYDLASGVETQITDGGTDRYAPAVSSSRVVWRDDRAGNADIYLAELLLPKATLNAPAVVGHGARVTVKAKLTSALDMPLAGRALLLRGSPDNEHWEDVGVGLTDALGACTFTTPPLFARTYLRAVFEGDPFYPAAEGSAIVVKPRALLGLPSAPSLMYTAKTYTVSGSLKPPHPAGSKLVSVRCYRLEAGRWRLKKSVAATLSDYPGYSRYHSRVRLPWTGSWRLCAYHADADHAATRSGWRYVGVR